MIDQIEVPYDSFPDKNWNKNFIGITKLRVLHSFKGKLWTDTLVHINKSSVSCGSSIHHLAIGQEVFLKAGLVNDIRMIKLYLNKDYFGDSVSKIIEQCEKNPNIVTMTCDVAIIPVNNGVASGSITRSVSKEWIKFNKLVNRNSKKANEYRREKILNKNHDEKLSIKKMYDVIDKQMKTYR